jgi:hypothetical protein
MQLKHEQLQFLARLHKSPDGQFLLQILRAKQSERDAALRTTKGEDVYRAQGRALELDELVADITEASQRLDRIRPSAPRTQLGAL